MNFAIHHQDGAELRRLGQTLESAGARCDAFTTAEALMHAAHHGDYDAALIDTRGHAAADHVLVAWMGCRPSPATSLLLVSAEPRAEVEVRLLDAGADDVVFAPVALDVVAARLRALYRRGRGASDERQRLRLAGFLLDRSTGSVQDGARSVELTPREFALAWFLFSRPATFVTREAISVAVWGVQADIAEHTIEQHVSMLRKKLRLSRERGAWIRAAYGRGYRLETQPAAARPPLARALHCDALAMAKQMEAVILHGRAPG